MRAERGQNGHLLCHPRVPARHSSPRQSWGHSESPRWERAGSERGLKARLSCHFARSLSGGPGLDACALQVQGP